MVEHQPDAEHVVPVRVALLDQLLRLAMRGLVVEARTNGVDPQPGIGRLLAEVDTARRTVHTGRTIDETVDRDEVSVPEAALLLGIPARTVRWRCAAGSIPARRHAGRWLIPRDALPQAATADEESSILGA